MKKEGEEVNRMTDRVATIWGWGEKFEDVKTNSEEYVGKRWEKTTKECCVDLIATERNEGISYYITAYTSDPENVGNLAEGLFYAALGEGNTKVYLIEIRLFDAMRSTTLKYCNTLEEVEKALEERKKALTNMFTNHPKVKEAAQGRKIKIIPQINLLCELESKIANKITIEVIHDEFTSMKNLLHSLNNKIIRRGLAERVAGYKLGRSIKDYKVGEIEVWNDEVIVLLI